MKIFNAGIHFIICFFLLFPSCSRKKPETSFDLVNLQKNNSGLSVIQSGVGFNQDILKIKTSKNEESQPCPELVQAARETHLRMYRVASGTEKPFGTIIQKIPGIYY